MTDSVIDRVARRICIALGDDPDREGERLTAYDEAARAAIEALREPTPEMIAAGSRARPYREDDGDYDAEEYRDNTEGTWTAMITAALETTHAAG